MKKKYIIFPSILIFLSIFLVIALKNVKPIEVTNSPDWVNIEDAFVQAATKQKLILVDVYEVGCKYCRAMEREVYPDPTVRAVLDAGYIPVKLNGNSEDLITIKGKKISAIGYAQSHGVYVFPTTLIMDADGAVVKKRTGYMGVDELRRFLYKSEG